MNKTKPNELGAAMADYIFDYLPVKKGVSANTVEAYTCTIGQFIRFLELDCGLSREKLDIGHISREKVEMFLDWLEAEKHNSVATRNYRRTTLNAFFKYLQYRNPAHVLLCQQAVSIPKKKDRRETVQHLSVEAVQAILKAPDLRTRKGRRDFALLDLLYESAARASELAGLTVQDFRTGGRAGHAIRLYGKGGKTRIVPLVDETAAIISGYIREESRNRPCRDEDPLFCNHSGRSLSRAGIAYIVKKYAAMAAASMPELENKDVFPHIFRHSRAMHWLEAGIDMEYIKDLLGHEDMETVRTYARLSLKMKDEALKKAQSETKNDADPSQESWTKDQSLVDWLKSFKKIEPCHNSNAE